jgi:SAM-dependent methyltransferase
VAETRSTLVAVGASIAAWALPGLGLWLLARYWADALTLVDAQRVFATSSLAAGFTLAPGGIVVTGGRLLEQMEGAGFPAAAAVVCVLAVRLATTGLATCLGVVIVALHWRTRIEHGGHFDAIADAYDVQIPEARRAALLARKTELMRDALERTGARRGLDVGCGQGWYVARMRELGFDVAGIDESSRQVQLAQQHVDSPALVTTGSILSIPAADDSYDFAYTINVLHHLASVDEQRAALREMARVVRPGGLLFVHEINTRNVLFRFYMGYVFPSLNCIDEGVERWLRPDGLHEYTDLPAIDVRYFTFLPDFLPQQLVRALRPFEERLEASRFAPYAAHYMAVLQKPLKHA